MEREKSMANEEQLAILKQGVEVWNKWREENPHVEIDLGKAELGGADLRGANLREAQLVGTNLTESVIGSASFGGGFLRADFQDSNWVNARLGLTLLVNADLSSAIGLEHIKHNAPSWISTNTFLFSKGKIPEVFLRGCGLSDWEIEAVKLYNPDLTNEERNRVLYKIYDLQASQAIQIYPLFISYSHADGTFVDKIESQLNQKGIRFWRDIHEMKSGRIERQIDRAIRQNPTVLLVLSEYSLSSDWVEHEIRTARQLEKEMGRDVLCPIALDDSWKSSRWPKRVMEQIMEYNILDFSAWRDDSKFEGMFRKLIDGLELFYKG